MIKKWLPLALTGLLIVGLAGFIFFGRSANKELIPEDIHSKINFLIYYPNDVNSWTTEVSQTGYDSEAGVLTIHSSNSQTNIVLTEQASPDVFKDVPEQYERLLNSLHQYAEITTSFGTVTLTKPEELKGGQSAVANLNGTLLFAKPDKDLSSEQWEDFFKSMEVIR